MKFSKFQLLSDVTAGFGIAGTLAIIIGGGSCVLGLSGTGVVKAGEFFSSHQPTLQKMMFYGGVGSSAGLFFVGMAAAVGVMRDKAGEEVIERIDARYQEAVRHSDAEPETRINGVAIPKPCQKCRNYHGVTYNDIPLICAIHPHGPEGEHCTDATDD